MKDLLKELNACSEAVEWSENKDWETIYKTCHRGDWLLWLFANTSDDLRLLTLAKGRCAELVTHLMKDQRSKDAVKAAIDFGEGRINREVLAAAATAADAAYDAAAATAAAADAAATATAAAYDAYDAADATATAAATAATATAAAYDAYDAADATATAAATAAYAAFRKKKEEILLKCADIVREVIPIEKWNIKIPVI